MKDNASVIAAALDLVVQKRIEKKRAASATGASETPINEPTMLYPAFLEEQEGWIPFEQRAEINGVIPMSEYEINAIWELELQLRAEEAAPLMAEYDRLIAENAGKPEPPYCGKLVTFGDRRVMLKIDIYKQFLTRMIKLAKKHKCEVDDVIACAVDDYLRRFDKM